MLGSISLETLPTSLPLATRTDYIPGEDDVTTAITDMDKDELALHCLPEAIETVGQRGSVFFGELTPSARETVLTRRLFETMAQSNTASSLDTASQRNKQTEYEAPLQEGNLVHATKPELLEHILANGLRCGEAVMGNNSDVIQYPFTVSFIEASEQVAASESMSDKLKTLRNSPYGCINLVFRGELGQIRLGGPSTQRQVFVGVPSTEISAIIVRDLDSLEPTRDILEQVVNNVVAHGQFIPVYDGQGQIILTSELYEHLRGW